MLALYKKHGVDHVMNMMQDLGPIADELDEFEEKTLEIQRMQHQQRTESMAKDAANSDTKSTRICDKCCGKITSRSHYVIGLIWFCLMTATLFGLSFGLIHIGNGIITLESAAQITLEMCQITNYAQTECALGFKTGFKYSYMVRADAKCPNQTLYSSNEDIVCGAVQLFDVGMNVRYFMI